MQKIDCKSIEDNNSIEELPKDSVKSFPMGYSCGILAANIVAGIICFILNLVDKLSWGVWFFPLVGIGYFVFSILMGGFE